MRKEDEAGGAQRSDGDGGLIQNHVSFPHHVRGRVCVSFTKSFV